MSLNIDVYFDDQIGSAFDEIASIFNVRRALSEQLLSSSDKSLEFDSRIRKNILYLLRQLDVTKEITYECLCEAEALNFADVSDVFSSAVLAFASGDEQWIARIVNVYLQLEDGQMGLVHALAWLPKSLSSPWIQRFLSSKDLNHKWLAVSVCVMQGTLPTKKLQELIKREDCQQHVGLFERLIFAAGQLKETSVHPFLRDAVLHESELIRCTAHWARFMMNDRNFLPKIVEFSLSSNEAFETLSSWIVLGHSLTDSKKYVAAALNASELAEDLIIQAIAMHGDPATLSWLIKKTENPALATWLALAFFQMTGIALDQPSLALDPQPEIENLDSSGLFLSQDMSIPYPNVEKLLALSDHVVRGFSPNKRHFLGRPVESVSQIYEQYQSFDLGLIRKYTCINSALSGQTYTPFDYLLPSHFELSVFGWLG